MNKSIAALAAAVIALYAGAVQAADKVSISALRFVSSSPVFIAKERGYFTAENIDLDIKFFNAAQPVTLAVASGDADFGITGLTGAFYNLAGSGVMKIVASQSREEPGYKFSAYVASTKAFEGGLKKPADFKGRTIGNTTAGSTFHYMLGRLSEKHGFKLSDMSLRALQTIPNMTAALKGAQVDGIIITSNNALQLEAEGSGKIVGWVSDETPWQLGALFARTRLIEENRPLVERFIRAYLRGAQDYAAAYLQRDAQGNRVFGEAAEKLQPIMEAYVDPKPSFDTVKASANYIDPEGRLMVDDIYNQVAWYKAEGLIKPETDAKSMLDLSFVKGHTGVPAN